MEKILLQVQKPARYTGNELNMIKKDRNKVDINMALCFPDLYEIGMSHLGMQILYSMVNERKDTYLERVFSPWDDMERKMREEDVEIFSLETKTPLKEFDIIGFSILYEMCYTNILNVLDLAKIPKLRDERAEDDPLIFAGGPCVYNSEPIADFLDFVYLGEGEVKMNELLDEYKQHKGTKKEFLNKISKIDGIYVPSLYEVEYNDDNTIKSIEPKNKNIKKKIKKVIVKNMDEAYFPDKPLVPLIKTTHDRAIIEVLRGCIRGCRFCQAGNIYRPVREKSPEVLIEQAKKIIDNTGYDELALLSLSTSDYTKLNELIDGLLEKLEGKNVSISLPSLRIDSMSLKLMKKVQGRRKTGLTFAPEAGSQRLRDVINKGLSEEEILKGAKNAFDEGWKRVKLYYMIGLPTENEEDLDEIVNLTNKITDLYYALPKEKRSRPVKVVASTSCFVPKPFTPFQWSEQNSYDEFMEKQRSIKNKFKSTNQIKYNYHDAKRSVLEGIVARGDRRLSKVILEAYNLGCRFDAWDEHFDFKKWEKAFENTGISMNFYWRKREYDEILPWDHIDIGMSKSFLIKESKKALIGEKTPNCKEKCSGCGATVFDGGICNEI